MGFGLNLSKNGSPFDCNACTKREIISRNCCNHLKLSEESRAVNDYKIGNIKEELFEKGAKKVFTLGITRLYECPLTYISRDTSEIIRLVYLIEDTKELLYDGGWANQPYWLVEAFEIYKHEYMKAKKSG